MSMLSHSCTYAIQACLYLAREGQSQRYIPVHRIARDLDIPFHFLKKILQRLGDRGLTKSVRSTNGGVALAKEPQEINVWDIISALDGVDRFETDCILRLSACNHRRPCALHKAWNKERQRLVKMFQTTDLLSGAVSVPTMLAVAAERSDGRRATNNSHPPLELESTFSQNVTQLD